MHPLRQLENPDYAIRVATEFEFRGTEAANHAMRAFATKVELIWSPFDLRNLFN
jgi:hypothetical protein